MMTDPTGFPAGLFPGGADTPEGDARENFGPEIPLNIYDRRPDYELEPFIPALLGEDFEKVLQYHANMRNSTKLTTLRQALAHGFVKGLIDVDSPEKAEADKRTGNDNNKDHKDNKLLVALMRRDNFLQLNSWASAAKISNVAALKRALNKLFDADKVIKRINDSEKATEAHLQRRYEAEYGIR
ncbi:MAG TPA: hypothetical protein V6C86_24170 [Oculatellaceae cyanobacterium]